MNSEILKRRTKAFAHGCVKLVAMLPRNNSLSWVIEKQLIKSSTSVAANYRAMCLAQTKPMFNMKLDIVVEESDESKFWLDFIKDERLLPERVCLLLCREASELTKIIISSRLTSRGRRKH